ncbi:hypothetical protein [Chryseobacterium sp. R2A-55]|nr:hypothetical protein [Chryseobacterium sp. R2A-55]
MDPDKDWIRVMNAQLRYYFHIPDPDLLSDHEWAARVAELKYIRKLETGI